jgi:hypothetical protein
VISERDVLASQFEDHPGTSTSALVRVVVFERRVTWLCTFAVFAVLNSALCLLIRCAPPSGWGKDEGAYYENSNTTCGTPADLHGHSPG